MSQSPKRMLALAGLALAGLATMRAQSFIFQISASPAPSSLIAEVRSVNGVPRLCINNRPVVPMAYKTLGKSKGAAYWSSCLETMATARDAGLHIYELRVGIHTMGLPTRILRGQSVTVNMDEFDDVVAIDPDARFIIALGLTPDPYYRTHNQVSASDPYPATEDYSGMIWDYDIPTGDLEPHDRQSPLSEKTWQDVEASVLEVVSQLESAYGDRIIMYWPSFSDLGEWCYDTWNGNRIPGFGPCTVAGFQAWSSNKYLSVDALNAAWGTTISNFQAISVPSWNQRSSRTSDGDFFNPDSNRYEVDFFDFLNGTMNYGAERIAAHIKKTAGPNKLVGMFWQYLHPLARTSVDKAGLNHSGHLKLMELLECPDIDVLGTPIYPEVEHWTMPFHGTVDTIQGHGKLFWHENDMSTHLSLHPEHSTGIGETLEVYAYDFQEWIARTCGFWFFDIVLNGETWSILNDSNIWNYVAERNAYWEEHCLSSNTPPFSPEIAVIRNERSARYMVSRNPVLPAVYSADKTNSLTQMIRHIVEVRDSPVGWYMLDDFINGRVPDSVKMYVFADTFVVDRGDAFRILDRLDAQPGCMALWFYAPGYLDPAHLPSQSATSIWFANRLTGGILPEVFATPVRDWLLPVSHTLTSGVREFGTGNSNFNPQFYIRSGLPGVETLCVYADDPAKIAAAILPADANRPWDSVYICSPTIAPKLLSNLVGRLDLTRVDGFNDATLSQWSVFSGNWAVEHGELFQTSEAGAQWIALDGFSASNLVVEADLRLSGTEWAGIQFRKTQEGNSYLDSGYLVHLRPGGLVTLYKPGGAIASAPSGFDPTSGFVRLRVEAFGSNIKVFANGKLLLNVVDTDYAEGYVGLCTLNNATARFDRIRVSRK